jgi:hypothetical protein
MRRNVYNIEVPEGTDYSVSFIYADPLTGLPVDLTGYSADMKVRTNNNGTYDGQSNPDFVLEFTTGSSPGGIVLGGTAGTVTLTVTAAQTTQLNWNRAVQELVLINSAGLRTVFFYGFFTILSSPT